MRAAMSPFDNFTPFQVLTKNSIGNNMGNMLFPYSVSRTLMTEGTQIDTIRFDKISSDEKILREKAEQINAEYDCLVLPFANAFRVSFMGELRKITKLVKRLKIPCVVVGAGLQAALGEEMDNSELAGVVTDFVKAILEKSRYLGLRGEYTADYLKSLGFRQEKDYTVIGCPSLYMHGKELPVPDCRPLTPRSTVSINSKISLPQNFHDFLHRCCQEIEDHYYIPQVIEEIYRMYVGMPFPKKFVKNVPENFPMDFSHPLYIQDRARSFVNVKSWLEFLRGMDFSFGSRIHGNIAGVLAGIPVYVFVSDTRIMELVDYHRIPHSMISEITDQTSIFDVYDKADFHSVLQGHEKRFLHYLDFLKKNGLDTIYDKKGNPGRVYFDEKIKEIDFHPAIHAFPAVSAGEQVKRLDAVLGRYRRLVRKK